MAISSPGVGSNLDVNGIVSSLMALERQPLTGLATKEASYQAKLSAYGNLKGKLSTFEVAMSGLATATRFQGMLASSGDNTVFTATANSSAAAGTYTVAVSQLAQAQSIYAAGQASTSATIGAGASTTLTFDFGTITGTATNGIYAGGTTWTPNAARVSGTVTIDSSNNSLAGIRDAINTANIGVSATIVNDGGASPYRLALSATHTGATEAMRISVAGDATLQGLLAYNAAGTQNLTQSTAAQNTTGTVNGISVSSATNTLNAIEGVTLNLAKVATSTLTVARDSAGVKAAVQSFVTAYNDISGLLSELSAYNAAAKKGAILLGDATALSLQAQMRSTLGSSLSGLGGSLSVLSQVGVTMQRDGKLALDATKLQTAIDNSFVDIPSLFATVGRPTDSLITFLSSTPDTAAGSYAVNVTTMATRGSITGSLAASTTITAGLDDTLGVIVNGIAATVTVPAGSYTATSLAAQLQSSINSASAISAAGLTVVVTEAAGVFTIASSTYGTSSLVNVSGGNGLATMLGAPADGTAGVNVAGTINGVAATGTAQTLTAAAATVANGIKIQITGGSVGDRGTINFSRGYAAKLELLANKFLETTGAITSRTDGINRSIKDLGNQRIDLNRRLEGIEARYRKQFSALDVLIGRMSQTSNFLTQQLANLPGSTSR